MRQSVISCAVRRASFDSRRARSALAAVIIVASPTLSTARVSVVRRIAYATLPLRSRHFTVPHLALALIHPADMEWMLWIGLAWVAVSVPVSLGFCALAISGDGPQQSENTAAPQRLAA